MIIREKPRSTWEAPPTEADTNKKASAFRRAMAMADEVGLDDDQRHELARMIPGVDKDGSGSWKMLTDKHLHDLNCMLDGYVYISYMKSLTE